MTSRQDSCSPDATSYHIKSDGARIAYCRTPGRDPGIVFLGGYSSDMTGTKALALEAYASARGQAFLRLDYQGHGRSSGDFRDGTIGMWLSDALAVIDAETAGPQILVGSSMGGWIMLLAALHRRARVAGLVGIAPAPDFTEELMWPDLDPEQQSTLERERILHVPSEYSDTPTIITMQLIEEARGHLILQETIPIMVPVRLLHGMRDPDVPWRHSLRLADRLATPDVQVTLVKDGDHRLSTPCDLALLTATLDQLLAAPEPGT